MHTAGGLRVLGVSVPDVSDWSEPLPRGKWSQFFAALAERFELVGVVRPELSCAEEYVNLARAFHPHRRRWSAHAGFNESLARRRTAAVQRGMRDRRGSYELIIQIQTLCAPGVDRGGVPYAIYTDNTMALTQRLYPQGTPLSSRAAAWWMQFEADVCRSASAVFTFSEFARRSVIDDYGCQADRVSAVGGGLNQVPDSLGERDLTTLRALFVGMDFERKGGLVLLQAWPIVRARLPDAELVIAGPARMSTDELPRGVSWAGTADRAQLAQLYESATVFVLPSLFEPWGLVLSEAMAYGLPCIGTRCCAMPEIIEEGVTGLLVPRHEPEPLAEALIELLSDPGKAAAMGRVAHTRVMHASRWSDVVARLAAHLEASQPPAPP